MNTVLTPTGLPVYFVPTSNPSVPNHLATPATAFVLVHAFLLSVTAGQGTLPSDEGRGNLSHVGYAKGFAQQAQARRLTRPNRVYVVSCIDHFVTDGLFTSGSSQPRVATTQ